MRVSDVAKVEDSVEDLYQTGFFNDRKAILMILRRQADANIIETVDAVRAQLPMLSALMPADVKMSVAQDRTPSIRASLHEAELTLVIAVGLVVLVVLLFLRRWRAALIPSVAVPVSLIGTFCVMYLCGYTLNTISLMALIVATGFVVDDAIVVLENIMRHVERGIADARRAALARGRLHRAVHEPVAGGGVHPDPADGRRGRAAVPRVRRHAVGRHRGVAGGVADAHADDVRAAAARRAGRTPAAGPAGALVRARLRGHAGRLPSHAGLGAGAWPADDADPGRGRRAERLSVRGGAQGFFPQQDTGQLLGFFRVDQGTSFQATVPKLDALRKVVLADPAVQSMTGFAGGRGGSNSSFMQIQLKPLQERGVSADVVINRLRGKLQNMPGARMFLVAQQDIRIGGRSSQGSYDYTLMSGDLQLLRTWMPKVQRAMAEVPEITDVDTDVEDKGARSTW